MNDESGQQAEATPQWSRTRQRQPIRKVHEVSVTQDHINRGEQKHPKTCALALALHENGFDDPHVSGIGISAVAKPFMPGDNRHMHNKADVQEWIAQFDNGQAEPTVIEFYDNGRHLITRLKD